MVTSRPDTITDADITRWRAEIARQADEHDDIEARTAFRQMLQHPEIAERAFFTGEWLGEQLHAAGCPSDVLQEICFANGQRCAFSRDPWAEAVNALDEWKKTGRWEKPGEELAARLFARDFPEFAKLAIKQQRARPPPHGPV